MSKNNPQLTPRESFLMSLLNKVTKEYKLLLDSTRRMKPYKIVEILHLSNVPGESKFAIQITNKNCFMQLTAGEVIANGYELKLFNDFHRKMIQQALQGKLIEFLKISEIEPLYKIVSKKYDRESNQHLFVIETKDHVCMTRTAEEISNDKSLLKNMSLDDVYDIGYTQGSESIIKERLDLLLAKGKI